MAGGDAAALERRIASLLAPDPSDDRPVAVATVRSIHVAHATAMPPAAAIEVAHDASLDGAFLHRRTWVDGAATPDPQDHADLALDIRAGLEDPAAVLPDLVHHVVRAGRPDLVERCLRLPIDLLHHDAPEQVVDVLVAAIEGAPAGLDDTVDAVRAIAADVAVGSDDPRAAQLLRDVAAHAHERGEGRAAARARYAASWSADPDEFARLREEIRTAGPDAGGWERRVVALDLADDDVDTSIQAEWDAVRAALAAGDGELEASALLGLDTHASIAGELDRAIRLQRRCVQVATRARAWRPAVFAHSNLAWSLLTRLDLEEAVRVCRSMLALVEEQALRVHAEDARLQSAAVLLAAGDHVAALRLVATDIDGGDADEERGWDAAYRAIRIAEVLLRTDTEAATDWVERARRCIDELDGGDLDLDVAMLEAELYTGARRGDAQSRMAARIGSDQALNEAQAIGVLARATAIDADPHAAEQLAVALGNVAWPRPPILELACDEAAAVRGGSVPRMLAVAQRWRDAGFAYDAALVEAGAALTSIRDGNGRTGGELLQSAHLSLASLGAHRALERLRTAREVELGEAAAPVRRAGTDGWLDDVPDATRLALASIAVRTTVAADRHLPAGIVGTLVEGCAVLEAADGRAVHVLGAGDPIGLDRLLGMSSTPPTGGLRAVTTCTVDAYPRDVLVVRLATDPAFARAIAGAGLADATRMFDALRIHGEPTMDARVLAILHRLAACVGTERRDGATVLRAAVSRDLLGELVGASRESVTRALTRLEELDALQRIGRRIALVEPVPAAR